MSVLIKWTISECVDSECGPLVSLLIMWTIGEWVNNECGPLMSLLIMNVDHW